MRFIEYLNEGDNLAPIMKDCGPFLKWLREDDCRTILKRFLKGINDPIVLKTARKDRRPKDSPGWLQDILDDAFEKKFGLRPRAEGVFCNPWMVSGASFDFTVDHFVLPVGNYKCIWSNINDLYVQWVDDVGSQAYDEDEHMPHTLKNYGEQTKKWAKEIVKEYKVDNNIEPYIGEVMVMCDKYYMVKDTIMGTIIENLLTKQAWHAIH